MPGDRGPSDTQALESVLEERLREKVRAAFGAQVDYVQVREKDLADRRLACLVEDLSRLPEKRASRLLINERLDLAVCGNADGVHLPSDAAPLSVVRERIGAKFLVGVSCHGESEVEQAFEGGASYVLLGPIFDTPSKPGARPLGVEALAQVCRRYPLPVFALGGVNPINAPDCIRAGAAGVAGIRLFQDAPDLETACRQLRSL